METPPDPSATAPGAEPRLRGWSSAGKAEVLNRGLSQQLDSQDLPQPSWCIRSCDRGEQQMTIAPNSLGMRAPLHLALRQVIIVRPSVITLHPGRIGRLRCSNLDEAQQSSPRVLRQAARPISLLTRRTSPVAPGCVRKP